MTISKAPSQLGCDWEEDCIEVCDADPVYVEENGVRASFPNPQRRKMRKIHYDGCYNNNEDQLKADYIIGVPKSLDIIVELKGSDRQHARDQLESTLEAWKESPIRHARIICLIVYGRLWGKNRKAGRIPKSNSRNESMELDFLRRHKVLLLIRESGSANFRFADLLETK